MGILHWHGSFSSASVTHFVAVTSIPGSRPANACKYMCKYVDQKCLTAMLATNRSEGVTPEKNIRNPLHTVDKACKGRYHQKSETGLSETP